MRSYDKQRDDASDAVIMLRNALGKTQQQFAVEVVKTSIGTVAVWETTRPPRGDTLLKLAEIAWKHGFYDLSDRIETLFLDDVIPRLRTTRGIDRRLPDGSGYVLYRFANPKDAAAGARVVRSFAHRLAQEKDR